MDTTLSPAGVSPPLPGSQEFRPQRPPFRRLRVFSFDPGAAMQLETALVNETALKLPWEEIAADGLQGAYVEVVDYDPASGQFYTSIDLNHPHVLAQDGLPPSEGSPQFHQQMVYAVSMATIKRFERALGRVVLWSKRTECREPTLDSTDCFVERLRIYPHALRQANAFYSPRKKALLFGYFPADLDQPGKNLPGGLVFTCLSFDVIAHETTHAILDGMHQRFLEPTNPDVLAFHEAFADIVALFLHFSNADVLRHQIAKTRGDLYTQSMLGQLAQQFGQATGRHGALRDALGEVDPVTGEWKRTRPDPSRIHRITEPHERGSILVAAVFDAFLAIYQRRIGDLLRIATGGSGILPDGAIHPDLVNRLSDEASKAASHVLNICIRALDYCPPIDITFGEYLRAMITADHDLVPDDPLNYRLAVIEAFRQRGIYPNDVKTLSEDSLIWQSPREDERINLGSVEYFHELLGQPLRELSEEWRSKGDRKQVYIAARRAAAAVHEAIVQLFDHERQFFRAVGLDPDIQKVEVHSVRPARRATPDGDTLEDFVITLTQKTDVSVPLGTDGMSDPFRFRGGSTLVVDGRLGEIRYIIRKDIRSTTRQMRQYRYESNAGATGLAATYRCSGGDEPFALLHAADPEAEMLRQEMERMEVRR
jgi:hypothetical protein